MSVSHSGGLSSLRGGKMGVEIRRDVTMVRLPREGEVTVRLWEMVPNMSVS